MMRRFLEIQTPEGQDNMRGDRRPGRVKRLSARGKSPLARRTFLRGAGVAMALPLLDALVSRNVQLRER
jgi:hypothetical protein